MTAKETQDLSTVITLLEVIRQENQLKHDEIIEHQKKTNGRVLKLEQETRVFRWAFNNPKSAIALLSLIIAGVIWLGSVIPFENLIKLL